MASQLGTMYDLAAYRDANSSKVVFLSKGMHEAPTLMPYNVIDVSQNAPPESPTFDPADPRR
jgi:hypothetical protein